MSHSPNKLTNPRLRRHSRVPKKVSGTAERPRLAVFRSKRHIVAQVIDDRAGHTIVAASSIEASLGGPGNHGTVAVATQVGTTVAERAKEAGITQVTFDRGGYQYHGRVAALADAARAAGLDF
jgi:large subunit ribosomal protein L18